ncbi:MAG: IS3 family transposase [Mycobacteriaceae bacterium]|nr:IS3 family transposase [Mycobacteriaceae bacterium]
MSVARLIADQRAKYLVPHSVCCVLLGVGESWFYKWIARASMAGPHTAAGLRRAAVDDAVAAGFDGARGLHGSPRLVSDLRDEGWVVSEKTVADSMHRQGLMARKIRRRQGLTRQDRTAAKFADLIKRDFTAAAPNTRWVGDMTEIPTATGKLYLATVIDLFSRRLLGAATSVHPDAALACAAIQMAVAARGGPTIIDGVVFHMDRGATYTASRFTALCAKLGIRQSMGRVGSCFDNAAAESFFSSLEWEVLFCNEFRDIVHARSVVIDWCYTFYNHQRRHSSAGGLSPVNYEIRETKPEPDAA